MNTEEGEWLEGLDDREEYERYTAAKRAMNDLDEAVKTRALNAEYLYTEVREYPGWRNEWTGKTFKPFKWEIDVVIEDDGTLIQVFQPHKLEWNNDH